MTPVDFAMEISIQESTAWSYFTRGAQFMDAAELLRTVPQLVSRDLWSALRSMSEDQRPEMGGRWSSPGGHPALVVTVDDGDRRHPVGTSRVARFSV